MPDRRFGDFSRGFDVGAKGISGHYDTMLGKFRDKSAEAVFTLAVWLWVATWPSNAVFIQLGPVVTAAMLIKLGLAIWTLRVWATIVTGLWYAWRWQRLEDGRLRFVIRNDHMLRVVFFRRKDNKLIFDNATQSQRIAQEVDANRIRRDRLFRELREAGVALLIFAALPVAYVAFPHLVGPRVAHWVRHAAIGLTPEGLVRHWMQQKADGNPPGPKTMAFCDWLRRPDVWAVITGLDLRIAFLALWFFTRVLPPISSAAWTAFDGAVHNGGAQYVPGAKVLEHTLDEKTLDTVRDEKVHGGLDFATPEEAARGMSR